MQADDTEHCYQKQTLSISLQWNSKRGKNHLVSAHPNELAITPQKNTLKSVEYMEYKISFSFLTY